MRKTIQWSLSLYLLGWLLLSGNLAVAADGSVVHAVLFYSPSCGHCHQVINDVLPPLLEKHGEQLQIVGVNIASTEGQALYQAAIEHFTIPAERRGVPTLIIGDVVLVGSLEIPGQLPGLIETYKAQGGIGWPAIPGLVEAITTDAPAATASPPGSTKTTPPTSLAATAVPTPPAPTSALPPDSGFIAEGPDWRALFARDPLGNSISVLVLLGMVASALYNGVAMTRPAPEIAQQRWQWAIPPLVVLGIIVAGYLAYVETQQVTAVCGPVGDCNAVQQSKFALLFGFLPVAVLGLLGYIAIGIAWVIARYMDGVWANLANLALAAMAWFGVGFSIYLTFLEPFVIGATCAWCLTSAVMMTLLLWVIVPITRPTVRALHSIVCTVQKSAASS